MKRPTNMTVTLGLALAVTAAPLLSLADVSKDNASPNVQKLLQECNALQGSGEPDAMDYSNFSYCIGYVGGIGDAMLANGQIVHPLNPVVSICDEGLISRGAMVQAFRNWAQKHPERWSDNDSLGVMAALRETWPCKAN
jgi:hypothetical protein